MENENTFPVWGIVLIIVGVVLVLALAALIIVKVVRHNQIKEADQKVVEKVEQTANALALCFGGNDNIKTIVQRGSRVTITVEDMSKIEKEKIDSQLSNVMYMGNKIVFVIGTMSEEFSRLLQENIDKQ